MSKSDKLFDEMFPRASLKLTPEVSALRRRRANVIDAEWRLLWFAETLMRRCLSHRQKTNLFENYSFWRTFYAFSEERSNMAGRKRNPERRTDDRAVWQGFLDLRLNDEQLVALDASKPKPSDLFASVDDIAQAGYRFMLSYNNRTKLVSVTLVDDNPDRATGGYALSSSDEDAAGALKMAIYKHMVLLEGDWSSLLDKPARSRRG